MSDDEVAAMGDKEAALVCATTGGDGRPHPIALRPRTQGTY
jgi:hypothetical protein